MAGGDDEILCIVGLELLRQGAKTELAADNALKPIIIPSSHSFMRPTKDSTSIVQVTGSVLDAVESLLSETGEVTALQTHGADYAEIAWQRRLRNQAAKKKKRGRGI